MNWSRFLPAARSNTRGKRDLDRILGSIIALYGPAVTCIVAGLDLRLEWPSQLP